MRVQWTHQPRDGTKKINHSKPSEFCKSVSNKLIFCGHRAIKYLCMCDISQLIGIFPAAAEYNSVETVWLATATLLEGNWWHWTRYMHRPYDLHLHRVCSVNEQEVDLINEWVLVRKAASLQLYIYIHNIYIYVTSESSSVFYYNLFSIALFFIKRSSW